MLLIAICALLWSSAGLLIKFVDWNPMLIAGGRSLIASLVILVWVGRPRFSWSRAQIGAALANTATMLLFVYANKATTAANAIVLQYTAPVFTALLGAKLLHERMRSEQIVAFPLVMIGMIIIFFDSLSAGTLIGNIAAVAAGVTFGIYFVFMRMQSKESPVLSVLLSHIITAIVALVAACFKPLPDFEFRALAGVAALGVFQIGLASILFAQGIKKATAIQAVLITLLEPTFSPVWVFLSTGEKPGLNCIVGGIIIIGAVSFASVISAKRAEPVEKTKSPENSDCAC